MRISKKYSSVSKVYGPLLVVQGIPDAAYNEVVTITTPTGEQRRGQVLETHKNKAVIQVFEGTRGIATKGTTVEFSGETIKIPVAPDMLGRIFDGVGNPIDGGAPLIAEGWRDVNGDPMNPASRSYPRDFIQTGISTIDGLNTLVRGQKLPIFSGHGLPHNQLAAQIVRQARLRQSDESFSIVFAAMGITNEEKLFFMNDFEKTGALEKVVAYINLADDPTIERLITPRIALTTAEYLAFEQGKHVLIILTDLTNYCEALREIAAARGEVPGRRGYPGYMYTDLATLYERAGRAHNQQGSITMMPILTMPDDDITHPIPDLTGYITEGQIVLSRELHRRGITPPVDVLPCLSRLMKGGIGPERTREDHSDVSNQLYAFYAGGLEIRSLAAVVGEDALTERDQTLLTFADRFEKEFIAQKPNENRTIDQTLDIGWKLMSLLPKKDLKNVKDAFIDKYHPQSKELDSRE